MKIPYLVPRPWLSGLLFATGMLLQTPAQAQFSKVESLGAVQRTEAAGNTLRLTFANATGEVTAYSPTILRVRLSQHPLATDFSYAVVASPSTAALRVQDAAESITITTDSVRLVIQKNPARFAFYNAAGQLLNQDEAGLGTSWVGDEITTYKKLLPGERFVGLGEKTGPLDRRGQAYVHQNTDSYAYPTGTDPLYSSIPFYMGLHDGLAYGLFFDNSYVGQVNFGASNDDRFSSFGARGGEMNYYLIGRRKPAGILEDYTHLTGRMPMPALWAIGFQQSRYTYYPDTEVKRIAQTFREKKIPLDVLYLDIHYMDAYKIFTWNPQRFPQPGKMLKDLKGLGVHMAVIVDPGMKTEAGYKQWEDGKARDLYVKYPDGTNFRAAVWPGLCNFPDFTLPAARQWWGQQFQGLVRDGVEGFWNDMNEMSTWGNQLPSNMLFNYDGHGATTNAARNVYGLQMARSTYEGTRKLMGGRRPLILTRAGYAGLQRYTAIWTGDNVSTDDHMLAGVRLVNSLGLSGVANAGMDVGGFVASPPPTGELFTRWMSIGAFTPFFRAHSAVNTKAAEPWAFGEDYTDINRDYVQLRYNLLPYVYSAFYEATQNGLPVQRSLALDYPHDGQIYDGQFQNEYQFGPGLLVAPVASTLQAAKVYLPAGRWYDFYSDELHAGGKAAYVPSPLDRLPVFVRGGSIIPMQSPVQYTAQAPLDTLYLHVYQGEAPSSYVYYEDDGTTYNHEKGQFFKRTIKLDPTAHTLELGPVQGSSKSKFKHVEVLFHGFGALPDLQADGKALKPQSRISYLQKPASLSGEHTTNPAVTVRNAPGAVRLKW
ncbi:glycoside hydrolase family 31 protein [Hymenobacter sp. BT770]|uniref:glycoside hydrolase family 31 protein n=1 Tax=Hymenobacter sp. BT770 TaxID=2886942 RepID=UPI001D119329|nr:glycoside hydrolase family 31 protein [Hymenobacter sp. BT770]MCC3155123.1 glycoside hydrolase family 31 protein [Hymenobacter sp. BT770]MDO3417154.1 glycoside hydrolase family 31 protein [Hymenobacter sp. BT770]